MVEQGARRCVAGYWKFSDKITKERLETFSRKLRCCGGARYKHLRVRRCAGENTYVIEFEYNLGPNENRKSFVDEMYKKLMSEFGGDWIQWDVSDDVSVIV